MLFVTDLARIPLLILSIGIVSVSLSNHQRYRIDCGLIGEAFLSGLLLFYLVAMVSPSFKAVTSCWAVGLTISAAGAITFLRRTKLDRLKPRYLTIIAGSFIIGWFAILTWTTPIFGHDARSIWSFHGKIIYYSDRILDGSSWTHPSIYFSHVDYPKVFASLAAAIAKSVGFWNEYIPNQAIVLLNIPVIFLVIDWGRSPLQSMLCLFLIWIFPGDKDQWGGYMDGILASYAGISSIFAARFLLNGRVRDIKISILCAAMCPCLKNEGLLFVLLSLPSVWIFRLVSNRFTRLVVEEKSQVIHGAVAFLPTFLWLLWSKSHGLHNDLLSSGHWYSQFLLRIWNPRSWKILFAYLLNRFLVIQVLELAIAIALIVALNGTHLSKRAQFALGHIVVVGLFYYVAIVFVYLGSYHDLIDHLDSSADRVILLPLVQLMAAIIVVMDQNRSTESAV